MMNMLDTQLEHRHGDEWHPLRPEQSGHPSGPNDPERGWSTGRLFRCVGCDEEVRVASLGETETSPGRARR